MVRPVVHSTKHYVQQSIATVAGGAVLTETMIAAVARDDINVVAEIAEGSIVKAVYIEVWARAGSATPASGQFVIYKKQSDTTDPTATEMAALGDWNNKRNIFYTTMGLINDQDADAIALFKGWIKIPKGKQRFALDDQFKWAYFTPTIDVQLCGFATYKEYS